MERVNQKKLNEVEGKEQYRVEVLNRFCRFGRFWTHRLKLIVPGKLLERT
jgi:hypothetical protein